MSLMFFTALAAALSLQAAAPPSAPAEGPEPAEQDAAQDVAPSEVRSIGARLWAGLSDEAKAQVDEILSKPAPQAVLTIEAPAPADTDFRLLDHGDVLSRQVARPAAFATIETPARNIRKYGPAGAVLWAGINGDGDWWCWRNGDRYPNWTTPSDIYCYRDTDNDGRFDVAKRNDTPEDSLGLSRFQFTDLGRDERLTDTISYRLGGHEDFAEKVVIRYDGPGSARIGSDGQLVDGVVEFQLLTGPGVMRPAPTGNILVQPAQTEPSDGLDIVAPLMVQLDKEGRGRYSDARGIIIEVDRVGIDGKARAKLVSALPAGRTLLLTPPTREEFLTLMMAMQLRGPR
jgi:hypothetical protein